MHRGDRERRERGRHTEGRERENGDVQRRETIEGGRERYTHRRKRERESLTGKGETAESRRHTQETSLH